MRIALPSISVAIHTASMSMMKVPARMSRPTDASTSSRSPVALLSFMARGPRVAFGDRVFSGGRKSFLRAKHRTSLHTTAPSTPECMKHNLPAKLEMVSSLNAPVACHRGTNSNNYSRKPYSTSNDTRHHGHYMSLPSWTITTILLRQHHEQHSMNPPKSRLIAMEVFIADVVVVVRSWHEI